MLYLAVPLYFCLRFLGCIQGHFSSDRRLSLFFFLVSHFTRHDNLSVTIILIAGIFLFLAAFLTRTLALQDAFDRAFFAINLRLGDITISRAQSARAPMSYKEGMQLSEQAESALPYDLVDLALPDTCFHLGCARRDVGMLSRDLLFEAPSQAPS